MNLGEFKGLTAYGLVDDSPKNGKRFKEKTKNAEKTNEKRLESLKNLTKFARSQENLVSEALKNTKIGSLNKKIKFDTSDDDLVLNNDEKYNNTSMDKLGTVRTSEKKNLFDDEEDENGQETNFDVAPQYQGNAGQQLLEMQSKFGGDSRFKMSAKFLDDFAATNGHAEKSAPVVEEPTLSETQVEQLQQINILEKVLGKRVKTTTVRKEDEHPAATTSGNNLMFVRYDPTNPSHKRFQRPVADDSNVSDEEETNIQNGGEKMEEKEEVRQQIVVEHGYEVDKSFAERLKHSIVSTEPAEKPFSLLAAFGRPIEETRRKQDEHFVEEVQVSKKLSNWQIDLLHGKKNHVHEENWTENAENCWEKKTKGEVAEKSNDRFFFSMEDPRLKESEKFCRKESLDVIRSRWEKKRKFLIALYKKRRKEAVRQLKKQDNRILFGRGKSNGRIKKAQKFKGKKSSKVKMPKPAVDR